MRPGRTASLFDLETLVAWWTAKDWKLLAPALEQIARAQVLRMFPGDDAQADEIAQGALVRAWSAKVVPDHPADFTKRIARNLVLDHLKHPNRRHELEDGKTIDPSFQVLDRLVLEEARELLRLALREIPPALSRPLILQAYHGRTIAELAVQFETTEGALKVRLFKARLALGEAYARISRRGLDRRSALELLAPLDAHVAPAAWPGSSLLERLRDNFQPTEYRALRALLDDLTPTESPR